MLQHTITLQVASDDLNELLTITFSGKGQSGKGGFTIQWNQNTGSGFVCLLCFAHAIRS